MVVADRLVVSPLRAGAEDVERVVQEAREIEDIPVVVDFQVSAERMVWPMVGPGVSNDDIGIARDMAPWWADSIVRGAVALDTDSSLSNGGSGVCEVKMKTVDTHYALVRIMAAVRRCNLSSCRIEVERKMDIKAYDF